MFSLIPAFSTLVAMFRRGSVLFLLLMVVHLTGFYVYFIVRMHAIHEQARAQISALSDHRLEKFEFTKERFREIGGEDGEIRVNDKMYDIARTESSDDRVVVYALHDADEDNVLAFISAVLDTAGQDRQQAPSSLTFFLTLNFLPVSAPVIPPSRGQTISHFTPLESFYLGRSNDPADRPPLA